MTTPSARVARVVHVITLLELGGAQQATLHTVAALDRQRFDVVLVAGKGGLLDEEARALPRTRVHLLEALVHPVRPLADLRAFLRLRRLFRDLRREDDLPLLVHTHSGKAGVLGRAAARMARAEVIVHHVHGLSYPPMKKSLAAPLGRAAERMADRWTHGYVSVCRANLEEGRRLGLYRRHGQDMDPIRQAQLISSPAYYGVGATYVNMRVVQEKGVIVAGLGGSRLYNGQPNQFSERSMYLRMVPMIPRLLLNRLFRGRYLDILLTHAPPLGINDRSDPCHRGFKAFLWFMRTFKPAYLVHGHVHLYDRNARRDARYGETTVINAYDHCLLEIPLPVKRRRKKRARRPHKLGR